MKRLNDPLHRKLYKLALNQSTTKTPAGKKKRNVLYANWSVAALD
jgi:hypothetical protein